MLKFICKANKKKIFFLFNICNLFSNSYKKHQLQTCSRKKIVTKAQRIDATMVCNNQVRKSFFKNLDQISFRSGFIISTNKSSKSNHFLGKIFKNTYLRKDEQLILYICGTFFRAPIFFGFEWLIIHYSVQETHPEVFLAQKLAKTAILEPLVQFQW